MLTLTVTASQRQALCLSFPSAHQASAWEYSSTVHRAESCAWDGMYRSPHPDTTCRSTLRACLDQFEFSIFTFLEENF